MSCLYASSTTVGFSFSYNDFNDVSAEANDGGCIHGDGNRFRFICCFTSCSTARVILGWVVYGWRNQCILVGQYSAL